MYVVLFVTFWEELHKKYVLLKIHGYPLDAKR